MAITTIHAHVNRALDFFGKDTMYFSIGRTSAWVDDNNPPEPSTSTQDISEIIGYKKVEVKYMVVPDEINGTIVYRNTKWRIVDQAQALTNGARWVYVEANILYTELPLGWYRQVGLYSGLQKAVGVSGSKYNLLPSEVLDNGVLEVVDNRQPSNRQSDQKDKLTLVLEF